MCSCSKNREPTHLQLSENVGAVLLSVSVSDDPCPVMVGYLFFLTFPREN